MCFDVGPGTGVAEAGGRTLNVEILFDLASFVLCPVCVWEECTMDRD